MKEAGKGREFCKDFTVKVMTSTTCAVNRTEILISLYRENIGA